ncbi:hypothetical protein J2X04_002385 [Lysobacter niabensis]|uniref:DUF885 domain-containing protein n=1 Tax=Agrilutibacter niabensis TaxID=380628 RepID=A0ABU1VR93_9GAMM|nr:hypothetical protein [Lysobacter niabensis]MDR7100004.1 hypothetical protein [Lysobacter niabensis]
MTLDRAAEEYVRLTLSIGEREPGYVDAYYGPAEWADDAKSIKRSLPELRTAVDDLNKRLDLIDSDSLPAMDARRKDFLAAQLVAARTRLAMMSGEKLGFDEEAEGLFALRPKLKPLSEYDPILAEIDRRVPGKGPLWERVDERVSQTAIPSDRLDSVMRASIAECRRRTIEHIALPSNETFTLELVTKQPWSGYNWYKGNATSLIQINTDLPVLMSRAVDLGCHEGYPGHHVLNMLLEQRLYTDRGWIEFTVYPLYSPQSFIAEGSANYGIELAFPDKDRQTFETKVLYPLAGLDPALAAQDAALQQMRNRLAGARLTIAKEYLDGRITRSEAVKLAQKYQLLSPERAEQSISFTDKYRSYVINYGLGLDMVRTFVSSSGSSSSDHWSAMEKILSEPTLPSDLLPGATATHR